MNFKKTYWQTSHYGVYLTEQVDGEISDPANYGLEWFELAALPPMIWPDERRLLEENAESMGEVVWRAIEG